MMRTATPRSPGRAPYLAGAAVQWTVQRRGRAGYGAVRVDLGRRDVAHRRGRAVELVLGMQDEQRVERLDQHRVRAVRLLAQVLLQGEETIESATRLAGAGAMCKRAGV